jgi:hypothetical protein
MVSTRKTSTKIVYKSGGSYKFNRRVLKKLLLNDERLADRFIVPISIAGPTKTGKSFLIGLFLFYLRSRFEDAKVFDWIQKRKGSDERFAFQNGMDERVTPRAYTYGTKCSQSSVW